MGLSISDRLVRLMGGSIEVESEEGHGSEFRFDVPLRVQPQRGKGTGEGADPDLIRSASILVVDDNSATRQFVTQIMVRAGASVSEASNGVTALESLWKRVAENRPFDLLVLSAQMPRMDGFQLAQVVRDDPNLSHTKIILITSVGTDGDGQRCRELGVAGYLSRPLAKHDLLEVAGRVLGRERENPGSPDDEELVTRHSIQEARASLRILLAEDNRVNQQVAEAMLRKRGHRVDVVENGRQAIEAAETGTYDVVLMDVQMPEMDGIQATLEIRARGVFETLPIIALTAHAMNQDRVRCLEAGMNGYLAKPFKPHELFAAVEGWGTFGAPTEIGGDVPIGEPPIDIAGLKSSLRDAGVEDVADKMLAVFRGDAPQRLAALDVAVATHDPERVADAAHGFKSLAGVVGALELARLLNDTYSAAREGNADRAGELLDLIHEECASVLGFLDSSGVGSP